MSDPTSLDRLWDPIKRVVDTMVRDLVGYPATYEYTITDTDGATVSGTPNDTTTGLPAINKAPQCASSIGGLLPVTGKLCHVKFMSGNLRYPRVVWCEPEAGSPVGRKGDPVSVTIPAATVVIAASGATLNPSPITLTGTITDGSPRVASE